MKSGFYSAKCIYIIVPKAAFVKVLTEKDYAEPNTKCPVIKILNDRPAGRSAALCARKVKKYIFFEKILEKKAY